jgi:surfeit locus 1 family protein
MLHHEDLRKHRSGGQGADLLANNKHIDTIFTGWGKMFKLMFSRKWLIATILVIIAMAVMVRLGKWQLDRLAQRRAFNTRVQEQIDAPPLTLQGDSLNADLTSMEYRKVRVTGEYDNAQEIAVRNQTLNGQWGVDLVTPLHIEGSDQYILVNRGWIPGDDYSSGDWSKFDETGQVTVQGIIRYSQDKADFGFRRDPIPKPGDSPLKTWNFVNIPGLSQQISYHLLPVYIQQAPDPAWTGMPIRTQPTLDLSEGPHMGYALQWFSFAIILGIGYPFFIRKREASLRKSGGQE